jgi:hypothetical protein
MTILFTGMIIGCMIGLLIGGFSTAWYYASKEITRLKRAIRTKDDV